MNDTQETPVNRKKIAVRFLYTLLFVIVLAILIKIIQLTILFQYVYLFISLKYNDRIRTFSNKISTYAYKVMRYISLNDNTPLFPFTDFPDEIEQPVEIVNF